MGFPESTATSPVLEGHGVETACLKPPLTPEGASGPALSGMLPTVFTHTFTSTAPVCSAASRYGFHNYPLNCATVASFYPSPEKCK